MSEKPRVIWFTGLSGAGKTTLAEKLAAYLKENGVKCELLDGDTVRNIFPQTGFTKKDRDEHVKRMGFLASMLERNGVTVLASFISPYRESRDFVRKMCRNFVEVYVSTSLEVCDPVILMMTQRLVWLMRRCSLLIVLSWCLPR